MSGRNIILALRVILGVVAIFIGYKIYRIIMEPIEFEAIREERYEAVIERLEQIREVEMAYKSKRNIPDFITEFPCDQQEVTKYCSDLDMLIEFIQLDSLDIIERKDTSYMAYSDVYQTDMLKEECFARVIGKISVLDQLKQNNPALFPADFNPEQLKYIPFTENEIFSLDTASIDRNGVKLHVFKVSAPNKLFFSDVFDSYKSLIKKLPIKELAIGALDEPTLNGNWKY
jgi:hypothetical protein